MARSTDPREEALGWYARWRLERERETGDEHMRDIRKALGGGDPDLGKVALSNALKARGVGMVVFFRLSDALNVEPWELLKEALRWWAHSGEKYREEKLRQEADRAKKPGSGTHPAVKASA